MKFTITLLLSFLLCGAVYAEKVRVVYRADGTVAVIHAAPKSRLPNETENQWYTRAFNDGMRGSLANLPYDDVDSSTLPDRTDRDCWEGEKGKPIKINAAKKAAKEKKKTDKVAAVNKLKGLGLSDDEIEALGIKF